MRSLTASHNGVHVEKALRSTVHNGLSGGRTLYCNVQHDRLGNKSHINKNHIVWREKERKWGREGDTLSWRRGEVRGGSPV